jgi:hypothetical protein
VSSRGAAGNKLRMTLGLPVYVNPRNQLETLICPASKSKSKYDEKNDISELI